MKEIFRESCRSFIDDEIEYGKLFEEYKITRKGNEKGGMVTRNETKYFFFLVLFRITYIKVYTYVNLSTCNLYR